ncbi:ion channel family protein [Mycobacterium xenopi 3993]|nr:ion channel family protein [Mycobacterium xenopi 3993]
MYYATVSLSTTGYGDITPYTEYTRLVNVVVMTPLRIAFLAVLVGTTLEVLSERSRQGWKIQRWRSRVRNHTVVIGYGTKGKTAVAAMLSDEVAPATSSSSTPTKPRWTTRRRRGWSPCMGMPPNPTCYGWRAHSMRRRSWWPPTATTPPRWLP